MNDRTAPSLATDELAGIEEAAFALAEAAGAEIAAAFGQTLTIRYKGETEGARAFRDPVSEVDQKVELLIRERIGQQFPDHDVIGEEMTERPSRGGATVWVVDPIDGTTNFVNGFPLFAASIGVLHEGVAVAGALWCSTSHALRSGIYHARIGGPVRFEREPIGARQSATIRRRLAGEPHVAHEAALPWDVRKTGSAALECAFVAAGLLQFARFERPNIWDIGGGVALVQAAGGAVASFDGAGWRPLDRFEPAPALAGRAPDLADWRRPLVLGEPETVRRVCEMNSRSEAP